MREMEECGIGNGQAKQYVVEYGLFGFDHQDPCGSLSLLVVSSTFKTGSASVDLEQKDTTESKTT